jgi:hypothetical protein
MGTGPDPTAGARLGGSECWGAFSAMVNRENIFAVGFKQRGGLVIRESVVEMPPFRPGQDHSSPNANWSDVLPLALP